MAKRSDFAGMDLLTAFGEKESSKSEIQLSDIVPNPSQPRVFGKEEVSDLVESMKRLGLIEPIVVRKSGKKYQIVAGERRYQAAKILKWNTIPAIETLASEDKCFEMALAENEKRKSLNPWEVGRAIQFLRKEKKKTAEEVSKILGFTERYVKQLSSIARLDQKSVGDLIKSGKDTSVKNLEALLKQKEGRGGEIISSRKLIQSKIVLQIGKLSLQQREKFLKELSSLKKKYGIKD
ncbi:ParB/RepB/Spo0J family partition protein [Leptospira interrogans]|uniref:ParB-like protein n=4 Tax=Leptospira interrogans TaxID=173 RepID=A0A0E2D2D2_LEPIR|nr:MULTISPECIES: ParB/RepB/Spo0J family partition protein [Leptospira]ASV07822.1 chromosome partitioning protein ParB [Leptospira interrogans serovar Canicola]ASV10298.1 chromosome partitioning protein ParB [Leptospira interrogans serovar Canicola]EJO79419.1 ParB-like protein [Leptospira interrogans serovar Pomona str. Kennewicki LC82-25]EJP15831.1 ParB-like protein [Leptospira interrogans str. FPW2026]EKN95321.1 ParB-like protein [Leptospira interrogans serovar Pomona str. Pomona]